MSGGIDGIGNQHHVSHVSATDGVVGSEHPVSLAVKEDVSTVLEHAATVSDPQLHTPDLPAAESVARPVHEDEGAAGVKHKGQGWDATRIPKMPQPVSSGSVVPSNQPPTTSPVGQPSPKSEVEQLIKQLGKKVSVFQPLVSYFQERYEPKKFVDSRLSELKTLVTGIQDAVKSNRLDWTKENKEATLDEVSNRLAQYIDKLDTFVKDNAEVKKYLVNKTMELLEKIDTIQVPKEQFEKLMPKGVFTGINSRLQFGADAKLQIGKNTYSIGNKIGEGGAASVYKCQHQSSAETSVIKFMKSPTDRGEHLSLLQEVYTGQKLAGSPNIMTPSFVAISEPDGDGVISLAIGMPYADQGDMRNVVNSLSSKGQQEKTSLVLNLLADAAKGLKAMHDEGYAHRDIKPDNVFVKTNTRGHLEGMIGDLGTACHRSDMTKELEPAGTPLYMPVGGQDTQASSPTSDVIGADNYAFGVMAFEMLSGKTLTDLPGVKQGVSLHLDASELITLVNTDLPGVPEDVKTLIKGAMDPSPRNRPLMSEWCTTLAATIPMPNLGVAPSVSPSPAKMDIQTAATATVVSSSEATGEASKAIQASGPYSMQARSSDELASDLFRQAEKINLVIDGGKNEVTGLKPILTALIQHDPKLKDVSPQLLDGLKKASFDDISDLAKFLDNIPDDSQTRDVLKMTHQSMMAPGRIQLSAYFPTESFHIAEKGKDRQLDVSLSKGEVRVTVSQTYLGKLDPEQKKADFMLNSELHMCLAGSPAVLESSILYPDAKLGEVSGDKGLAIQNTLNALVGTPPTTAPVGPPSAKSEVSNVSVAAFPKNKAVPNLLKQLDRRVDVFRPIVNYFQKLYDPAKYVESKIGKLDNLLDTIQSEVDTNRLAWNKETKQTAIDMVAEKVQKYIDDLDTFAKGNPDLKNQLLKKVNDLLGKINQVVARGVLTTSNGQLTGPLEINGDTYTPGECLGAGSFGVVSKYTKENTGEVFAVKLPSGVVDMHEMLQEVYIGQACSGNKHIMAPSFVAKIPGSGNEPSKLAIGMPIADQGSLKSFGLSDYLSLKLLGDAADGVAGMHRRGFAHRDIKPDNVFVKTNASGQPEALIGDLGGALHESEFDTTANSLGTPLYMNVFDAKPGFSGDSYAFGVMAFEILFKEALSSYEVQGSHNDRRVNYIDTSGIIDSMNYSQIAVPDEVKSLITKSLSEVPEDRPKMAEWRDTLRGIPLMMTGRMQ